MTNFEAYAYNKRISEFFEKVYNHEPIALLSRRNYKTVDVFVKNNAICITTGYDDELRVLSNLSNEEIDLMAHLYASCRLVELQNFLYDCCKYCTYLSENFFIELIDRNRPVYYNESTIEYFMGEKESVEYRLLRNQMIIMSALRNIIPNDNIKGLLDDNIKPTAEMLQILSEHN